MRLSRSLGAGFCPALTHARGPRGHTAHTANATALCMRQPDRKNGGPAHPLAATPFSLTSHLLNLSLHLGGATALESTARPDGGPPASPGPAAAPGTGKKVESL